MVSRVSLQGPYGRVSLQGLYESDRFSLKGLYGKVRLQSLQGLYGRVTTVFRVSMRVSLQGLYGRVSLQRLSELAPYYFVTFFWRATYLYSNRNIFNTSLYTILHVLRIETIPVL